MILPVQKCEHEVDMKQLLGKTELWHFPIICEEIWAGVEKVTFPTQANNFEKHSSTENHHVPTSQHNAQQAPVSA